MRKNLHECKKSSTIVTENGKHYKMNSFLRLVLILLIPMRVLAECEVMMQQEFGGNQHIAVEADGLSPRYLMLYVSALDDVGRHEEAQRIYQRLMESDKYYQPKTDR